MRPLTTADVTDKYCRWLSDPATNYYIETAHRTNIKEDLINYVAERSSRADVLFLGIYEAVGGEHIGNIKYEPIDLKNKYAVMGIMIGQPKWRGKGVGPEVICITAKWLKSKMGIEEIVLGVEKENIQGIRAYEKCGFKTAFTNKINVEPSKAVTMVLNLRTI